MKRKLLSLLLALAMTLSLATTSTFAVSYPDSQGHWAEDSIDRWSDYGMIQGNNGQFNPNGTLTRAHMAAMLSRLLNLPAAGSHGFLDVKDGDWFQDVIDRCAAAGIMLGNNGYANPNSPITREQAMVMLCRALGLQPADPSALDAFEDADQVSEYARGYLAALVNAGILKGDNGKLNPRSNITRAQMVVIVDRMVGCYANEEGQTVSAENGGIILVTARNVKVVNAPEGATVIVTDSAGGLTVNGVKVSSGQTYTVPAAETQKPASSTSSSSGGHSHSHSYAEAWTYDADYHWHAATCGHSTVSDKAEHSYDATTNKCECGKFAPTVTAEVNGVGYTTLAGAVDAAEAGQTIKLLDNVTLTETLVINKNLTLDLNGKTISAGEVNEPIQITGDVTITGNGTINGATKEIQAEKATSTYKYDTKSVIAVKGTGAKLTMPNGTVNAYGNKDKGMYGIASHNGGMIVLGNNDGTGPEVNGYCAAVGTNNLTSPSTVTINGGTYTAVLTPQTEGMSEAYARFCAVVYAAASGDITINGGNFTGYYGVSSPYVDAALTLTINGGEFNTTKGTLFVGELNGGSNMGTRTLAITGGSFTDINTALKYTADNATITILKGSDETVAVTQVPAGNNVTIKATEGVVVSKVGGSHWNKSTTFDGLHFKDGVGISLTAYSGEVSYKVINCTFENVTATAWKEGVISLRKDGGAHEGTIINATVSGNTIKDVQNKADGDERITTYGPQSDGIYIGGVSTATVTNNIVEDVDGTGIYISGTGTFTITGNTISEWGTGATDGNEGRAIRTDGGSSVTITGNKMLDATSYEEYIKSTNCTSLNVSGNYWGGHNPTESGVYEGIADATLENYYSDAAMQVLMPIGGLPSTAPAGTDE